LRRADFAGN